MFCWISITLFFTFIITGYIYSRTKAGPMRHYNVDLKGKIVIITGSSAGVGKETARKLAYLRATIIFACRSKEKTLPIINEMKKQCNNENLHFLYLDLPNYTSVREFVQEFKLKFKKIDILINNAGIFIMNEQRNAQQHELTFATNHLGHYLLTNLLLDYMNPGARIINVASGAHEFLKQAPDFQQAIEGRLQKGMKTYATSKFANILFTQALQEQLNQQKINVKVVSIHPGFVRSEIYRAKNGQNAILSKIATIFIAFLSQFSLSEEEGARTTEYTALQPFEELVPAGYYQKNNLSQSTKLVRTCGLEKNLMEISAKAVQL